MNADVSLSQSNSSATGATQFGNYTAGSIGVSSTTLLIIVGAVIAVLVGGFFLLKK